MYLFSDKEDYIYMRNKLRALFRIKEDWLILCMQIWSDVVSITPRLMHSLDAKINIGL